MDGGGVDGGHESREIGEGCGWIVGGEKGVSISIIDGSEGKRSGGAEMGVEIECFQSESSLVPSFCELGDTKSANGIAGKRSFRTDDQSGAVRYPVA